MSPIAYSVPLTAASLAKLTATQWNASVRDNIIFLANPPACRVYHSVDQSITDNTETTVAFNSERFDPTTMHDNVTNNSRITFATAGVYVVTFHCWFQSGTDYSQFEVRFRKNGGTVIHLENRQPTAFGTTQTISASTIYKFAAADYLEVRVRQDNTANAARLLVANGEFSPEFAVAWVGLG